VTSSLTTLAAAPAATHSEIPSPVTILLVVAAVGYVLWSRMQGRPLKLKRMLLLPVVLLVLGITDLTGSSAPHLTSKDIAFLLVGVAFSAALGAARGATIELYPQQGELWQRYRKITVVLWIALIAIKLVLIAIASAAGASAGSGTNTLLLALGVSLLAEAAIVAPRAASTGLPLATGHRPSATTRVPAMTPPQDRPASRSVAETGLADDDYRRHGHHHHDHHHNHHGLTGPS
jgi:hypothetical protein